ncbi:MAG TPA: hypothetical protein VJB98_02155 [Candidatus Paceibacterota bacterium]
MDQKPVRFNEWLEAELKKTTPLEIDNYLGSLEKTGPEEIVLGTISASTVRYVCTATRVGKVIEADLEEMRKLQARGRTVEAARMTEGIHYLTFRKDLVTKLFWDEARMDVNDETNTVFNVQGTMLRHGGQIIIYEGAVNIFDLLAQVPTPGI